MILISNLGKVDDFKGKPVMCLPEDPVLRLYRKGEELEVQKESPLRISEALIYVEEDHPDQEGDQDGEGEEEGMEDPFEDGEEGLSSP